MSRTVVTQPVLDQHIEFAGVRPKDLPTPPRAALQILRACAAENATADRLAKLISNDPVLTAELLRVVNSAFFGYTRKIGSISQAVVVLGQRALRNMVLCISVRKALTKEAIAGLDTEEFWEDAIRRAVGAQLLGKALRLEQDECFTAGLLQDFGLLALFYLRPDKINTWAHLRASDPDTRLVMEEEIFHTNHCAVGKMLTELWEFPAEICEVLGNHHGHESPEDDLSGTLLPNVLYCADWINAVFSSEKKALGLERTRQIGEQRFGLSADQIEELLHQLPPMLEEAAQALGLGSRPQDDFATVLREAHVRLAEENISFQELTWRLERALEDRDRLAQELRKELELAREIQRSLLPPGYLDNFSVTGVNIPAGTLSGDFYDYFKVKDEKICFALGDVAGKGTNAAILMAKTCSLFRCLGKYILDPKKLMSIINAEICETSTRGMFVTMVIGLFSPDSGEIILVNAGHLPALLIGKDGTVKSFAAQTMPLGIIPDAEFPEIRLSLSGGSFYMFSDGMTEARIANGQELGLGGLKDILVELREELPQDRLESLLSRFKDEAITPKDDLTLLLLE